MCAGWKTKTLRRTISSASELVLQRQVSGTGPGYMSICSFN